MEENKVYKIVSLVQEKSEEYGKNAISNSNDIHKFLKDKLENLATEVFGAVFLNAKNKVVSWGIFATGTFSYCMISPRMVFSHALLSGAASMILFHNHPTGVIDPSNEDIKFTDLLAKGAEILELRVLDHLIVGDDIYSFRQNNLIRG